jgi:hypothetical protein
MALTADQRWIATKIDTRVQKLIRAGKDDRSIFSAMADHMPKFKQLLDTAHLADLDELTKKFPGVYRYEKIIEALAGDIRSGAIPMPGQTNAPQPTKPMTDHRQRAAVIDLRLRQMAEEGVPQSAVIERMTAYVLDLRGNWKVILTASACSAACGAFSAPDVNAIMRACI